MVTHHHQPEYHSEISLHYVKATIISTRASEILKLSQSRLVWWSSQDRVRHPEKIFLLLHRAWDREYGLGDCGLVCCHSLPSQYLKQVSILVPIMKMWKEHCFCNEYSLLFIFWSMVQVCDYYILLYLWWCIRNMWDRLLIECDWLLTLEGKKHISLWHYCGEKTKN